MFQNKVVLLVGATGGLGSAAALAFAQQGAKLILAGRDMEKLQRLSRQFSAPAIQVDISDPDSISDLLTKVQVDFPKVDLVVNLTGADVRKSLEAHSLDEIQRLISVNLAGDLSYKIIFAKDGSSTRWSNFACRRVCRRAIGFPVLQCRCCHARWHLCFH